MTAVPLGGCCDLLVLSPPPRWLDVRGAIVRVVGGFNCTSSVSSVAIASLFPMASNATALSVRVSTATR